VPQRGIGGVGEVLVLAAGGAFGLELRGRPPPEWNLIQRCQSSHAPPAGGGSAFRFAAAPAGSGISFSAGNPPTSRSRRGRTHEPEIFGCAGGAGAAAGLEHAAAVNTTAAVEIRRRCRITPGAPCRPP